MNGKERAGERDALTQKVIGLAIEVHRELGPGLLESIYEECLLYELKHAGMMAERQVPMPVRYKELEFEAGYRIDVLLPDQLVIELKTVDKILPIHRAQILTYLKLSGIRRGLLMNFNVPVLKDGIERLVF